MASHAVMTSGAVRCWGNGVDGRLGYGNTSNVGDSTGNTPAVAGDVDLDGATVEQMSLGDAHSCVLLDTGGVRCWGMGSFGQLGYGSNETIGDNEVPVAQDVSIL